MQLYKKDDRLISALKPYFKTHGQLDKPVTFNIPLTRPVQESQLIAGLGPTSNFPDRSTFIAVSTNTGDPTMPNFLSILVFVLNGHYRWIEFASLA